MEHPALEFLNLLDLSPSATFNVETFPDAKDAKDRPKPDPLVKRYPNRSLDDVRGMIPLFDRLNQQGAAIYIAVNEFNGQRKLENLTRVRGVHADLDGVTEEQLRTLRDTLPPTIVVQTSSPNKQHWYWLLIEGEELDANTAKAINQKLVALGADKAAVDVTRLLRLPGFRHMKSFKKGTADA